MKFEDLLMQQSEGKQSVKGLEEEVEILRQELDGELQLHTVLQCALHQPFHCSDFVSSLLPPQVQVLMTELTTVEEEIIWLERKVDELKLDLYREKKQTRDWEMIQMQSGQWQRKLLIPRQKMRMEHDAKHKNRHVGEERRTSVGSFMEMQSSALLGSTGNMDQNSRCSSSRSWGGHFQFDIEVDDEKPNKLSEELIKCLIGIYIQLNHATFEMKGSGVLPKCSLSSIKPRGLISKASLSCTSSPFSGDSEKSNIDPYRILQDFDVTIRDIGAYKDFVQITRNSIDKSHLSECRPAMRRLRVLMHKLSNVDLSRLTCKQKLAFWINTYNACIMHVQHFCSRDFPLARTNY